MVVIFCHSLVRGGIYHVTNLGCAVWHYSLEWGFYYPEPFYIGLPLCICMQRASL